MHHNPNSGKRIWQGRRSDRRHKHSGPRGPFLPSTWIYTGSDEMKAPTSSRLIMLTKYMRVVFTYVYIYIFTYICTYVYDELQVGPYHFWQHGTMVVSKAPSLHPSSHHHIVNFIPFDFPDQNINPHLIELHKEPTLDLEWFWWKLQLECNRLVVDHFYPWN